MWFFVIFIPPIYFLQRKRWGAFVANALLYFVALVTLIIVIGVFFWALAVAHAAWNYRKELQSEFVHEQASAIAKAMKDSR